MSTIKNALAALKRNKGRNVFIAIIMFVILTISCIALIINNTANTIRNEQKANYGSKATIQLDEEALKKYSSSNDGSMSTGALSIPELDNDLLLSLAKSSYLKDTLIETSFTAVSNSLKKVEKETMSGGAFASSITMGGTPNEDIPSPDYSIHGYSIHHGDSLLSSANRKLVEGELPKGELDCMISDELAKANTLKTGDLIRIKALQYDASKPDTKEMELRVSGIYQALPSSDSNMMSFGLEEIYMLYEATLDEAYNNNAYLNTTYYLNSPDDLQAFEKEARELHLPQDFKVTTDEASYQQVVGPIDGMAQISFLFLLVVLLLGGALLILLTFMNIRDRNYEIGILRSLGMRKQNVILQMIMEPIFIIACTFVISCGLGTLIAQPISDHLLASQLKESEGMQMSGTIMMSSVTGPQQESIKEMQVQLDATTLSQVFAISILIVLLSGFISSFYIVKYEPMEILSERR